MPTLVVTDVNRTLPGLTPVQRERQDLIERRHRASTEAAIALGIPIATGTDTGEVGVTADMVAREIALLHDHGAIADGGHPGRDERGGSAARHRRRDSARSRRASWRISCWSRATRWPTSAAW